MDLSSTLSHLLSVQDIAFPQHSHLSTHNRIFSYSKSCKHLVISICSVSFVHYTPNILTQISRDPERDPERDPARRDLYWMCI